MHHIALYLAGISIVHAAQPFVNEPDTGLDDLLGGTDPHVLPDIVHLVGLPDFEWVARRYLNNASYAWYRSAAAGEWSYRNNLEVFDRIGMKPRVLVDITNVEDTLPTSILGHNFSAPFFISPAAKAGYAHPKAEEGLVKGAAAGNILYIPSMRGNLSIEQIAAAKPDSNQVLFQQLYVSNNLSQTIATMRRAEKEGYKAFFLTVDAPASGVRHRGRRFGVYNNPSRFTKLTWNLYKQLQNMTSLPIVPKGIISIEDARMAVQAGAPAIFLSNHGGRQLDTSPSAMEAAIEIHRQAPEIFKKVEVYADGGVRYGTDVLKLLAMGVRAVGIGRPFMYANVYGSKGVERAIDIMKGEIALDAANLGIGDLRKLDVNYFNYNGL
ncbi:cytochrome b2 [Corynespora cassiicola Philippines]|uniref:Cytochrome b2 n=1 Tax=Corynespora cassiicola Philippines TaxID=1448308 RepID=A0A2T2N840_CORCC|nr:cytochrome b2 [Corynespora cassiicola Philippines]